MFDKLTELKVKKDELMEQMRKLGEIAIRDAIKEFFSLHPEVEALGWKQYTPYFNDGDACYFSVGEVEVKFVNTDGNYKDTFCSSYNSSVRDNAKLSSDLSELSRGLEAVEEVLEEAFGDHARITATRTEITVDEYEHD